MKEKFKTILNESSAEVKASFFEQLGSFVQHFIENIENAIGTHETAVSACNESNVSTNVNSEASTAEQGGVSATVGV